MNEDGGYLLAKVLGLVFKNRPSRAYIAFVSIIVMVLIVLLFGADKNDDLLFPILGLSFVSLVVLGQVIQAVRRRGVEEVNYPIEIPPQPEPGISLREEILPKSSPLIAPRTELSHPVFLPMIGAIVAGVLSASALCISGLIIPTTSHDTVEGISYIVAFAIIIISPLIAGMAALGILLMIWITRQRQSQPSLVGVTILLGAGIGLLLGIGAGQMVVYLICHGSTLC